ncbi:MAG: thiamine pyrophosphate-requiring protein [Rhodospirillales bacterium]|nr:thiamine pyrophosphate-requiring protein [Rhodospirillales bacterium]
MKNSYSVQSVAEAFLVLLKRRGVDNFYVNGGTDFASMVEGYARLPESGLEFPKPIVCPHENLAVGMANGYTMVTGRAQAVMCHVTVGAANAICNLMNAARDNVPMLFAAGRTPLFEKGKLGSRNGNIHWAQEMFDQGGMLRELVKWDYELRDGINVEQVVDRALTITNASPQGPVYLMLPREVLAQQMSDLTLTQDELAIPTQPAPDPVALDRLAAMIAAAKCPVIVTATAGRNPKDVPILAEIAERFAIGVVENFPRYMNFPSSHPMHLGYSSQPILKDADLLVVIESDVPWIPALGEPNAGAKIVQIGVDPAFGNYPIRTFHTDLAILSSVTELLKPLSAALEKATAGRDADIKSRRRRLGELHEARHQRVKDMIEPLKASPKMTKNWLNYCVNQVKPADTIMVNEYWTNREINAIDEPGTYFQHSPAGGLGWGVPAALGAAQAAPGKIVIATVGDGAYMFANPTACHQVSEAQKLPFLTIVCNNAHWGAVENSALGVYPVGHAAESRKRGRAPLSDLAPSPAFEKTVEASGGYGERVTDPADLPNAIKRAIEVIRKEKRQALLNVICE